MEWTEEKLKKIYRELKRGWLRESRNGETWTAADGAVMSVPFFKYWHDCLEPLGILNYDYVDATPPFFQQVLCSCKANPRACCTYSPTCCTHATREGKFDIYAELVATGHRTQHLLCDTIQDSGKGELCYFEPYRFSCIFVIPKETAEKILILGP